MTRLPTKVIPTTNRRKAIEGADFVLNLTRIGGLDAFQLDIDIPLKYGVDQCVGDTLYIGGVMYGQRTLPQILGFCKDIREVAAPNCLFLKYATPNAMNTWAANKHGQRLAVEAAVHGDVTLLKQAALMDPLTAAVCTPPEISQMVDEMLVAQSRWLPQYANAIPAARKRFASEPRLGIHDTKGAARVHTKTVEEMQRNAEEARLNAAAADKAMSKRKESAAKAIGKKCN